MKWRDFDEDEVQVIATILKKDQLTTRQILDGLVDRGTGQLRAVNRVIWNVQIARAMRASFKDKDAFSVPFLITMCEGVANLQDPCIENQWRLIAAILCHAPVINELQKNIRSTDEYCNEICIDQDIIISCFYMARNDLFHGDMMYRFILPQDGRWTCWHYVNPPRTPSKTIDVFGNYSYEKLEKLLVKACLEFIDTKDFPEYSET